MVTRTVTHDGLQTVYREPAKASDHVALRPTKKHPKNLDSPDLKRCRILASSDEGAYGRYSFSALMISEKNNNRETDRDGKNMKVFAPVFRISIAGRAFERPGI
jgi:hypothetical protein